MTTGPETREAAGAEAAGAEAAGADAAAGRAPVRWARVLALLVLAAALLEVGGRAAIYAWAGRPFRSLSFYRWSPYGLVRNNPRLTSPAFAINENGFRDLRAYTREKPPRTLRVLLLGGSVLYSGLAGRAFIQHEGRVGSDATIAQYLEARLRRDPQLAGLDVEVINAAVNFNRVVEIASAYLTEYVFWRPDVVVVFGSANNFLGRRPRPAERGASNPVQAMHPWRGEFERLVNSTTLASWVERTLRALEEHSAAAAIGRRTAAAAIDRAAALSARYSLTPRGDSSPAPAAPPAVPDSVLVAELLTDYLGFANALAATARTHGQDIAFFWEYFLGHLGGVKPFSPDEEFLYSIERAGAADVEYGQRVHDAVRGNLERLGVPLIDPLPELRQFRGTVFIDYLHYTKTGNRLMADVVYDRLAPVFHTRAGRLRGGA